MNDLERELRNALDREAGDAPSPHDSHASVRRARRRQIATVAMSGLGVAAAVLVAVVGVRALGNPSEEAVPASTTDTMNGITITFPDDWALIDPDAAGLNGPDPAPDVPRLILALAPIDPGELFACPGMAETPHTLLMTIQEQPLALSGDAARAWPVELQPLDAGTSESGCYPGWEFLRADWTAEGRTFEATIGLAPDVTDADRDALLGAFASMTFSPGSGGATSFIIATDTTAGEDWELIARMEGGGLTLELEAQSFGAGIGVFDDATDALELTSHRIGEGPDAQRIVFGVVRANATRLGLHVTGGAEVAMPAPEIVDIPGGLTRDFDAFVFTIGLDQTAVLTAFDASNREIGAATTGPPPWREQDGPVETPPQEETPLEDGRHFGFARAVDVDARTIEFDLAYFLTGEEANEAYQEATGETGPVPNDYYVVNENPRLRELRLSSDVQIMLVDWANCCEQTIEGDLEPFATAIEEREDVFVGDVIYRGNSSWWITVQDGVVTRIEEQYTP